MAERSALMGEIIRPNATLVSTGVTIVNGATAHDAIDDAVTTAVTPATSDYVSVGASDTLEVGFADPSSSAVLNRPVKLIRAAWYGSVGSQGGVPLSAFDLRKTDGTVLGQMGSAQLSAQWRVADIAVNGLALADLNGLKVRVAGFTGTTQVHQIHVVYLELFTAQPVETVV